MKTEPRQDQRSSEYRWLQDTGAASAGKHSFFHLPHRAFDKFVNDWTMNLASMIAYTALTSFIPLVLAIITLLSVLPVTGNGQALAAQLNTIMPANVRSEFDVEALVQGIHRASRLLTLVSIVGLLIGGTNLFGSIESAFAMIYRVKTRDFVPQKLMSLAMILLLVLLLPISFASSVALTTANTTLHSITSSFISSVAGQAAGHFTSLVSLFLLFAAIYIVVPNRPVAWSEAWRGAALAAVVMWLINTLFPFYTAHFINTRQYAAAAIAGAISTIIWFWFFSVTLLLGAQLNALTIELAPWRHDISRTLADLAAADQPSSQRRKARKKHHFLPFSGIARDSRVHEVEDTVEAAQSAQPVVGAAAPAWRARQLERRILAVSIAIGVLRGLFHRPWKRG